MTTTIPTTQKSLLLHQESTPYVVGETQVPTPGPKDVLVKILACALNPVDYAIVNPPYSKMFIRQWPHIPCTDGAGVVVALGAEVTSLKEGDRMYVPSMPLAASAPGGVWRCECIMLTRGDACCCSVFQGSYSVQSATGQQYTTVPEDLAAIVSCTFPEYNRKLTR